PHSPPPFLSTDRPTTQIYTLSLHDALPISLHACRAAVEEGILPGGGVAVIRAAAKVLDGVRKKVANEDQQIGVDIVRRAIEAPIKQIVENAGMDGGVVAQKVKESSETNFGYNAL